MSINILFYAVKQYLWYG